MYAAGVGRKGPDALRVLVEHAFQPRESLTSWLDSLVECTASLFPSELGAVGRLWDGHGLRTVGSYAVHVRSPRVARTFMRHHERSAHRIDFLREGRSSTGPHSARRILKRWSPTDPYLRGLLETFDDVGVQDMRHLTSCDGDGMWLTLGIVQTESRPLAGRASCWTRVGRQLALALHAQRCFDALRVRFDGGAGDTHHRLREALCELDARCSGLHLEESVELWCELARGTFRSIDVFDCDGRRYHVLAPAFEDGAELPGQLSSSELELAGYVASGKSEKWIALTLGVARSTVDAHLDVVLAKLGQRSRLDLIKAFRVQHGYAVPALSLRAHALGSRCYLLAFDLAPSETNDGCSHPSLTSAQWRVSRLALQGLSDRAIAQRLELSPHTVSHHLRHAYARLGVGNRAELVAALRRA